MSIETVEVILAVVVAVLAASALYRTSRNPNRSDGKPDGGDDHRGNDDRGNGHGGGGGD